MGILRNILPDRGIQPPKYVREGRVLAIPRALIQQWWSVKA